MTIFIVLLVLIGLAAAGFRLGRSRAVALAGGHSRGLHSLPGYYGWYVAMWCAVPALLVMAVWLAAEPAVVRTLVVRNMPEEMRSLPPQRMELLLNDIRNIASGDVVRANPEPSVSAAAEHYAGLKRLAFGAMAALVFACAAGGLSLAWRRLSPDFRARNAVEKGVMALLVASALIAILITLGIVLSLVFEAARFFAMIPIHEFLFGLHWSPQTAIRTDQVGASGEFGAIPLFTGTLLITAIAMAVAVPVGLLSAIYMAEYAPARVRDFVKPALEVLAGIPTVVYGFFAALTVAPFVREAGSQFLGLNVSSESALAAGVVMGVMIIPFVSSLSDDVIVAVPRSLREGSYGLGATKSETIKLVVLPAALPGIVGAVLLAVSRAIGETMIVVMAAGLAANLTANPFEAVTTVTVQIVTLLVGDQEFDSPKTLAAFALGLVLFLVTLALNVVALTTVRKYREKYD